MKCRRCREPAVIDVRRHNAGFCADCFTRHCREQVRRAIEDHEMIAPGQRVLVAVSGGKDSLGLWHLLRALGYEADGLYVGLGIGEYSDESADMARAFAVAHDWPLLEVDLRSTYGFDVPSGARAIRRVPVPVRMSKRHVFNDAAQLRRARDRSQPRRRSRGVARQRVALGAGYSDGSTRCCRGARLRAEGEAAGAVGRARARGLLRADRHRLHRRGVPDGRGNRHLGYKELLNEIEERSPGTKAVPCSASRARPRTVRGRRTRGARTCTRAPSAARRLRPTCAPSAGCAPGPLARSPYGWTLRDRTVPCG